MHSDCNSSVHVLFFMTAMMGRCGAPVGGYNDADELGELGLVAWSALHRKHVVGYLIDVIP